jgi:glutamate carboxypeptidase
LAGWVCCGGGAGCVGGAGRAWPEPGRGNGCGTGCCVCDPSTALITTAAIHMSRIYHLRDFCRAEREWLLETVEALVRLESPTDDKAAVDRCGAELARRLVSIGARVTRLPRPERGDHILAQFDHGPVEAGVSRDGRQVLLLGHFDTVWPVGQIDRMPLVRSNGRLHGPGVFDMKSGIAIAMLAARAIVETGTPLSHRLVMLWTTDEEVGSATSRAVIENEARRSAAVLVLEPSLPGGAAKTSRKGCGVYELVVRGVSAHAGIEPEKGASAVQELAHQILRINALQDPARGISVNVVRVSGGLRSNVIPDDARAVIDVRVPTAAAAAEIHEAFRRLSAVDARTTLEAKGGFDRPPLERTAGVARLYDQGRAVARELGAELAEGGTGGGSDGNFTAALGVPTLDGLGAIGAGAHALHEHVDIDSLADRAALVAGLVTRIE